MAETSSSLQENHNLKHPFMALDPKSLILSQFSNNSDQFHTLELKSESFFMEKGPRYREYAARRESRLRMKHMKQSTPIIEEVEELSVSPPKKETKFQRNLITPPRRGKGSSVLTQSVPDFSSALRKENRKPPTTLPAIMEKSVTPPMKSKSGKCDGITGKAVGSKSADSGGKRSGGFVGRKSYASFEEFKGLASQAKNAINVEARGIKNSRIIRKSGFLNRQF